MKLKQVLVVIAFIMGLTLVFFINKVNGLNLTRKQLHNNQEIVSPSNWVPGQTINKDIYVVNESDNDVAVRVSYEEEWISRSGHKLTGVQNGQRAALINFANKEDWVQDGEYFYYLYRLKSGSRTSNFIDSVTFNRQIENDDKCTRTIEGDILRVSCMSSNEGYDGATYKLKINMEILDINVYQNIWQTKIQIKN